MAIQVHLSFVTGHFIMSLIAMQKFFISRCLITSFSIDLDSEKNPGVFDHQKSYFSSTIQMLAQPRRRHHGWFHRLLRRHWNFYFVHSCLTVSKDHSIIMRCFYEFNSFSFCSI